MSHSFLPCCTQWKVGSLRLSSSKVWYMQLRSPECQCRKLLQERRYPWLRGSEGAPKASVTPDSSAASTSGGSPDVSERSDVAKALQALHAIYEVRVCRQNREYRRYTKDRHGRLRHTTSALSANFACWPGLLAISAYEVLCSTSSWYLSCRSVFLYAVHMKFARLQGRDSFLCTVSAVIITVRPYLGTLLPMYQS
jgi:hypothetical protein